MSSRTVGRMLRSRTGPSDRLLFWCGRSVQACDAPRATITGPSSKRTHDVFWIEEEPPSRGTNAS